MTGFWRNDSNPRQAMLLSQDFLTLRTGSTLGKIRRPLERMNKEVYWQMFRLILKHQLEYGK